MALDDLAEKRGVTYELAIEDDATDPKQAFEAALEDEGLETVETLTSPRPTRTSVHC